MKRCESSFQYGDFKAIRILILSLIALNITHFGFNILEFFQQTLFLMQNRDKILKSPKKDSEERLNSNRNILIQVPDEFNLINNVLVYLLKNKFISIKIEESSQEPKVSNELEYDPQTLYMSCFEVTKLGLAAIKGNIDLDFTHQLYSDLNIGLKNMVLSNYLHLLFLCTPYDLVNSLVSIDYDTYARIVL